MFTFFHKDVYLYLQLSNQNRQYRILFEKQLAIVYQVHYF